MNAHEALAAYRKKHPKPRKNQPKKLTQPRRLPQHSAYGLGDFRTKIWRSMRILRRFTLPDLIATAEAKPAPVQRYLGTLKKAGYVKRQMPSGSPFGEWILIRETGPHAPRIRMVDGVATVWDYNLEKQVWTDEKQ